MANGNIIWWKEIICIWPQKQRLLKRKEDLDIKPNEKKLFIAKNNLGEPYAFLNLYSNISTLDKYI